MRTWNRAQLLAECERQKEIHRLEGESDAAREHLTGARFHGSQLTFWASLAHELARDPVTVPAA